MEITIWTAISPWSELKLALDELFFSFHMQIVSVPFLLQIVGGHSQFRDHVSVQTFISWWEQPFMQQCLWCPLLKHPVTRGWALRPGRTSGTTWLSSEDTGSLSEQGGTGPGIKMSWGQFSLVPEYLHDLSLPYSRNHCSDSSQSLGWSPRFRIS